MSVTDDTLAANAEFAARFDGPATSPPARQVAVVACMDSRVDPLPILGLAVGDAHVIRNAGGLVTDDALRSVVISQRALGTREVIVMQHTKCGMATSTDTEFRAALREDTGVEPSWAPGFFPDIDDSVRAGIARVEGDPHVVSAAVRGFVYDVDTGALREVSS